jgi:predicted nucleic acid-binding protein
MAEKHLFVLDTSALLALRGDEPGADRVQALLARAQSGQNRLLMSFMSRMEILYIVWREEGEVFARDALRLIDSFQIEWISCEPRILEIASSLKAGGGLSIADSWIGATAIAHQAILVHKDPEFSKFTEVLQEMLHS